MKHVVIKNFGPLKDVDIRLGKINLIIGMQSSGKSCAMMVACYCTWVEKRISLRQSAKEYSYKDYFIEGLISYYHAKGYLHNNTYIEYESPYMKFSYDHANKHFTHIWGNNHLNYKRPKVSYVPAERNMISLVSNWDRLETNYDSILDFKADFDIAKKFIKQETNVLGSGISYEYDEDTGTDSLITENGVRLSLMNSSSGMQSLIPQFVHLRYLANGIYKAEKEKTFSERQFTYNLLNILYERSYGCGQNIMGKHAVIVHIEGKDFVFASEESANTFKLFANNLLETHHTEVFLEEPESNLFPPTQFQLMNMIVEMVQENSDHKNFFFIATHSPYVLSHLLQENIPDFHLLLTIPVEDGYDIKEASDDELQEIYDNGSDAFFNFEAFAAQ